MERPADIRSLIDCWPRRQDLVDDLLKLGCERVTIAAVHKWAENGAIRSIYQLAVLKAARGRDIPITADDMVRFHSGLPIVDEISDPIDDAAEDAA